MGRSQCRRCTAAATRVRARCAVAPIRLARGSCPVHGFRCPPQAPAAPSAALSLSYLPRSRGRHCAAGGGGPVAHRPRAALCRRRGGAPGSPAPCCWSLLLKSARNKAFTPPSPWSPCSPFVLLPHNPFASLPHIPNPQGKFTYGVMGVAAATFLFWSGVGTRVFPQARRCARLRWCCGWLCRSSARLECSRAGRCKTCPCCTRSH